jgi:hypothetical protein
MAASSDAETLMERQRLFNEGLNTALRDTAVDPGKAIEQLPALLSEANAREAEVRARSGGPDQIAEYWRDTRLTIHTAVCASDASSV